MKIMKNATTRLGRLALVAGTVAVLGFAPAAFADETVALKNALYGAGYDITNVNSRMDDATRSELSRFQKDNGLQASGILDEESKKALGMISVQVAAAAPARQPEKTQPAAGSNPEPVEEDAVEEEDDGGWSFF
ncbi:Putative peptidoglycan binding domain-containing protein [Marinobacter antarcticus]|uniref:Putative peptidoglycan binding domain-containing protein n=2 Tax=Marinobacter antarcticus TaxID=564117 RepID=A0A1M6UTM6_9GAMM|nr:Putative peptidoglycan binding domain-containing protein [Marinobacter antarcticus]